MIDKNFLRSIGINPYSSVVINKGYKHAMDCTYDELIHDYEKYLCFLLDITSEQYKLKPVNISISDVCSKIALLKVAKGLYHA